MSHEEVFNRWIEIVNGVKCATEVSKVRGGGVMDGCCWLLLLRLLL